MSRSIREASTPASRGGVGAARARLTAEQAAGIHALYGKLTARQIAARLGVKCCTVHNFCHRVGLGRGTRLFHGDAFAAFVRDKNAAGWSDAEVAAAYAAGLDGRKVDRHTVAAWRKKMGLAAADRSEHYRERVRATTAKQLQAADVPTLGHLRVKVFRDRARRAGWPDDLRPRAVQILNALWDVGPMTRRQIAEAVGMPWKGSRKSLVSNDPEGSYLAHLAARGLVVVLKRAAKVTGQGKGRSCDVYTLPLWIERGQSYEQQTNQRNDDSHERGSPAVDSNAA